MDIIKSMDRIKKILRSLGPGFITGASDDDPSGIATYSQSGAIFGFSQLWTAVVTFPLMSAVQEMCGKIGLVTGKGLAGVIKEHYPKKILYFCVFLLFAANTINIGADLGAMADSARLILGLSFYFWLFIMVLLILALEILVSYKSYSKILKFLTLSLLAYVATAFIVKINWREAFFSTIFPTIKFSKEYLFAFVAIFGTSISPYLFFWQASEEVEEEVAHHKLRQMGAGLPKIKPKDLSRLRVDTITGMFFSQLIMWFIIAATASTLFLNGTGKIETASEAALVLRPLAGDFAYLLFALGIIGTGFLVVPILAGSASYAVSEAFGWKEGLYRKFKKAKGFYGTIIASTIIGIFINFIGISSITALYYTAVINGLIAPPLLIMILLISNNKKIMGERVNNKSLNILGLLTIIIMSLGGIALLASLAK